MLFDTEEHFLFLSLLKVSGASMPLESLVSPGAFREMSTITPDTVVQGRAYVFWIKDMSGYTDPDNMYGVAFRGNSRFGHQDFSIICKARNKKTFYSRMIKNGEENPTWQDCLDALKMEKAPIGTPKMFTDRAYTFAELACVAYNDKYFYDQEGLNHLSQKTAPSKPGTKKLETEEQELDPSEIIKRAKIASDELDKAKKSDPNSTHFTHPVIPGSCPPGLGTGNSKPEEQKQVETLDEEVENMRERAVMAETRAASLLHDREVLEKKVEDLKAKLETSLEHQKNFMLSADKATLTLESMNDDTATKVLKKIEPKLHRLPSMDSNLGSLLAKVTEIGTAVANLPQLVKEQSQVAKAGMLAGLHSKLDGLGASAECNTESLSEGLITIENTLASYGMTEDGDNVDIPACMKSLLEKGTKGSSNRGQVVKPCSFIDAKTVATFSCICGCGREIQYDYQVGPAQGKPDAGAVVHVGQVDATQQPGFARGQIPVHTQTVPYHPGQQRTTSVPLYGHAAPASPASTSWSTSTGPNKTTSWSTPLLSAPYIEPAITPGNQPTAKNDNPDGSDPPVLTRKQKRMARLQEHKDRMASKKLKLSYESSQSGSLHSYDRRGGQDNSVRYGELCQGQAGHGSGYPYGRGGGQANIANYGEPSQGQAGRGGGYPYGREGGQTNTASYGEPSQGQAGRGGGYPYGRGGGQTNTVSYGEPSQGHVGYSGGSRNSNQQRSFLPNWGQGILQQPNTIWNNQPTKNPNQ